VIAERVVEAERGARDLTLPERQRIATQRPGVRAMESAAVPTFRTTKITAGATMPPSLPFGNGARRGSRR
jgi:hypothetical protein